jgi:hypothetical protein
VTSTKAQADELYRRLPVSCTLCETSLEMCAVQMRPSHVYALYTGARLQPHARMVLKHIGATSKEHPFAPYINLQFDPRLEPQEWCITNCEDEAWGSEGL